MIKDPKEMVQELVSLVGKKQAREALKKAKVNDSTAEKLVGGRYTSDVGFLLYKKIERALASAIEKKSA